MVQVENDGERGGATERGGMADATKGDQAGGLKEAKKCSSVDNVLLQTKDSVMRKEEEEC